jgi:DNA-binding MarR family transcriptional regulator
MDADLRKQFVQALFRLKRMSMSLPQGCGVGMKGFDINMTELALMRNIRMNRFGAEANTCAADIRQSLFITKAGVSQTLGALEKKGYIARETDKSNRRRIVVTLTESGLAVAEDAERVFNAMLAEIISRFGEEDMRQFVRLVNRFTDIAEEIKRAAPAGNGPKV